MTKGVRNSLNLFTHVSSIKWKEKMDIQKQGKLNIYARKGGKWRRVK